MHRAGLANINTLIRFSGTILEPRKVLKNKKRKKEKKIKEKPKSQQKKNNGNFFWGGRFLGASL